MPNMLKVDQHAGFILQSTTVQTVAATNDVVQMVTVN